jgi:hypothetical protein
VVPLQIVVFALPVNSGLALTVTVMLLLDVHPFVPEPVTV